MNWRITPTLVEETTGPVQMVEVIFVRLAAPKVHICHFKVAPEVTRRVALSTFVTFGPSLVVNQPVECVILMEIVWVVGEELDGFGPECREGLGLVVQVYCETVRLVVVLHVTEYVVVNITEEVNIWFNPPVPPRILQGGMFVE